MTKAFCDMCGDGPIPDRVPDSATLRLETAKWFGTKQTQGSIGPTDGTWTPTYSMRPVFGAENISQLGSGSFAPDLCAPCMIRLLLELIKKLEQTK